jgi:predicted anti-sigma-YlaC factor YlaD
MRCETAKRRISDALDGALGEGPTARLGRHLQGCPGCRAYCEGLSRIQGGAAGLADPALDPEDWAALLRRLEGRLARERVGESRPCLPAVWKVAWAGAGLLALLFALVYLAGFRPRTPSPPMPLSFEDSVAQVMGEVGANPDLAGAFDREIAASIAEAVLPEGGEEIVSFGDNPFFWEGLTDGEVGSINAELEKELARGGLS